MNTPYCQSCGMPLNSNKDCGTNPDQSRNGDFCHYCYRDGAFTEDLTMEEMIDHCLQYLDEFNEETGQRLSEDEAKAQMNLFFPTLKRWKRDN